jgi:hypothetical protein
VDFNEIKTVVNKLRDETDELYTRTVSVKDYGATGDGVTDDTAAIHETIDGNDSIEFEPYKEYYIGSFLADTEDRDIVIDGKGSKLFRDGDYRIFRAKANELRLVKVTAIVDADDNIGAPLMSQITTAFTHQCSVGDLISIGSNTNDDIDPVLTRMGEITTVYAVINTTNILTHRLEKTFDLSEDKTVNLYRLSKKKLTFKNFDLETRLSTVQALTVSMISFTGYTNLNVSGINIPYTSGGAISLGACVEAFVKDIKIGYAEDQQHSPNITTSSYGISGSGVSYCIFSNIIGRNTRHVIDFSGTRSGVRGYSAYNQVNNCIGYNNTSGSFSMHQGTWRNTFNNCKSIRSTQGFNVRGVENIFDNCKSIYDYIGCQVINDQAAGGSWTKDNKFNNSEFIDSKIGAIRISDHGNMDRVQLDNCVMTANRSGVFETYFIRNQNAIAPLVVNNLTININNNLTTPRLIYNESTAPIIINTLTINILTGITLGTYSIFEVLNDCNIIVNTLRLNCADAGNYPEYLFKVASGKIITGYVSNVYLSGIDTKLNSELMDNQTFVNTFSHGSLQLGATTLTPV